MLMALPTNIRLDWKGLPGTNTLAYCYPLSYEENEVMRILSQTLDCVKDITLENNRALSPTRWCYNPQYKLLHFLTVTFLHREEGTSF